MTDTMETMCSALKSLNVYMAIYFKIVINNEINQK